MGGGGGLMRDRMGDLGLRPPPPDPDNAQVLEDFQNAASEAIETGDTTALQTERQKHKQQAVAFLEGSQQAKSEKPLQRQDAFHWLLCAQHILTSMAGTSLDRFIMRCSKNDPWPSEPTSWRSLSIALDQGADGWSACNFLANGCQANVTILPDASHRVWNDSLLAMSDAGLSGAMFGFVVLLNLDSGPWESAKFFHQARKASDTYLQVADERCPMFLHYLERILDDRDWKERSCEAGIEELVFEGLGVAFRRKTTRVPMSRWRHRV